MSPTIQQKTNAALLDIVERGLNLLIREEALTEPERARIHALTRAVRMSDFDLSVIESRIVGCIPRRDAGMFSEGPREMEDTGIMATLRDLRDRYEGLGKYAPAAPSQPEEVNR